MKTFHFQQTSYVPRPLPETFAFFSDARNLQRITPPWLDFRVVTPEPILLQAGTLIDYRLRLRGVPLGWRTRIKEWEPPHGFVDEQLRGPYRVWVHRHRFHAEGSGTRMDDHVTYAMPFGLLGEIAQRLFVARDVARIFAYRQERLHELLPPAEAASV